MRQGEEAVVGREAELVQLESLLDGLDTGAAACLAVEGEPGIGKTRLLSELRRRAANRDYLVLAGAAAEFERDMPFAAWADALDPFVASRDGEWDEELVAELSGVLPSLRRAPGDARSTLPDERYRAHRAMRRLLQLIAEERPVVLVLDDLHWSDGASVELIVALLRRELKAPVLFALGFRTGKAPVALGGALGSPSVSLLRLEPLSEADCLALAGEGVPVEQRAAIYAESGGNPFYALQLARSAALPAGSAPVERVAGGTGVPSVVAAALVEELQSLSPAARVLLEAGAIAGDPLEPELAYEIAELSDGTAVTALDELLDCGLLHPTEVPRQFAFRHPLVRRAVYESAKGGWRLTAHARAATALAERGASATARAHHVEQSAGRGDQQAIDILIEAGDSNTQHSPAGSARWYAAALRLLPSSETTERLGVLVKLAETQRSVGHLEDCCESLLQAIDLMPQDDTGMRVRLISACAFAENFLGRHEQAKRRVAAVIENAPDSTSRDAVTAQLDLAGIAFFQGEFERMRELAADALSAARPLGEPGLLATAAVMLAHAGALTGAIADAESSRDEGAGLIDGSDDTELAPYLEAVNRLAWTEFYLERFEESMAHAKRGIGISRATGQGQFMSLMSGVQALSAMMLGELTIAGELQENAIDSARLTANDWLMSTALITSSFVLSQKGDLEGAVRAAQESADLVARLDSGLVTGLAAARCAVALMEAGAPAAEAAGTIAAAGGWEMSVLPAGFRALNSEALTRSALQQGDQEAAERHAANASQAATELGLPVAIALGHRARAEMHLAAGQAAEAARLAEQSAQEADAAGAVVEGARARALAGRAVAADGKRDAAIKLLREAESVLDARGAERARDEARRELRKLGARAEPRGPAAEGDSGVASLSTREREVAELITERKTNREVAAALFLSEKTVESHLRNIFAKLGASSRVEVARAVERAATE